MNFILKRDKVTKNTIRFQGETVETQNKNIYLLKSEVVELGNPDRIQVTIKPIK